MLVMDTINSKPNINGTSNANDDSEEEEEISSEYQQESPRINVTDNEVVESEMADSAIIMALASSPTAATDCPRLQLQLQHTSPQSPKSSDISLLSLNIFSPLIGTSLVDDVANTQPTPHDLKQLERDKNTVYSHPLFPLLALLFEKCEIATSSISSFDTDASLTSFNTEIEEFIQHQQSSEKSFFTNNPEVDSLMIRAIQVFRIHLLELEKVSDLCKDFCQRYISCLRTKMRSDVLLRGTGSNNTDDLMKSDDLLDNFSETNQQPHETSSTFLSSSASSMSSSSGSGSALCSSPQGIIHCPSPPSPSLSTSSLRSSNPHSSHTPDLDLSKSPMSPYLGINFDQVINPYYKFSIPKYNILNVNFTEDNSRTNEVQNEDNMVVHDLSLKKKATNNSPSHNNDNVSTANRCKNTLTSMALVAVNNVDNTSDIATPKPAKTSQTKSKKSYLEKVSTGSHSKRGVLPKQATSIMRSWLFQHIVHPYPTEDEKRAIASETNLTLLQVNNWFINARRRILQPMLDSANSVHSELVTNSGETPTDLDLFSKTTKIGPNSVHSKKLKTNSSSQLNRFWPQSLANIIQTSDLNSKT